MASGPSGEDFVGSEKREDMRDCTPSRARDWR